MEPVERGHAACDEAAMILSEISDGGFVAPEDFPESTKGPSCRWFCAARFGVVGNSPGWR